MSLSSTFEIGVRALRAFQTAIQTISHNISNVNTPGYSRQRVIFGTTPPDLGEKYLVGRGVEIIGIERSRDQFFEDQWRRENSTFQEATILSQTLSASSTYFQEPLETGLAAQMDKFWASWDDLANNPTDPGIRAMVVNRGGQVASTLQRIRTGLDDQRTQLNGDVQNSVRIINKLAADINSLNGRIDEAQSRGAIPNDLLDTRDNLVGQLSAEVQIQVHEKSNKTISVYLGGVPLVETGQVNTLGTIAKTDALNGMVLPSWEAFDESVDINGGRLHGLISARDTELPNLIDRLDSFTGQFINQVNALHRSGIGLDGDKQLTGSAAFSGALLENGTFGINGVNIQVFAGDNLNSIVIRLNAEEANTGIHAVNVNNRLVLTPSTTSTPQTLHVTNDANGILLDLGIVNDFFKGSSTLDIDVSDALRKNSDYVAASGTGSGGDNSNAIALSGLKNALVFSNNTQTINGAYQALVTDLGSSTEAAFHSVENQKFVLAQINDYRESFSGVSLDEELANQMSYQRAYEMAAKMISTADEMMTTLLNMIHT